MRGHLPIIAMRQRGLVPRTVFIDAFEDLSKGWRHWPAVDMALPQVEILPDDQLTNLDLRFVVGLQVMVTGHHPRRVQAIADACTTAGAKRVVATCIHADTANLIEI